MAIVSSKSDDCDSKLERLISWLRIQCYFHNRNRYLPKHTRTVPMYRIGQILYATAVDDTPT